MQNLLILYNPYYNQEMIEDHIRILNSSEVSIDAKVAFGKIRSKIRNYEHSKEKEIVELCLAVTAQKPLQLFLTDFSSMYVCYVEEINIDKGNVPSPKYYDTLDIEGWFIVTDIREIVRNDFNYVRDQILVHFTTPNYGNHTYALYGNRYDYPLEVKQKKELNYFESYIDGERHFKKVFKSSTYTTVQKNLQHYIFGKELFYAMHLDSMESIVAAEVQYDEHKDNITYDFASIVINYAKAFENESYYFLRTLFEHLMGYDASLESIEYSVQGRYYTLIDYLAYKPNIGTNKYLLSNSGIYNAYKGCYNDFKKHAELWSLLSFKLKNAITNIQTIRNEASHGGSIAKEECDRVRRIILGIGEESIIVNMLKCKRDIL